jgi:thioesterase domain-containing protein
MSRVVIKEAQSRALRGSIQGFLDVPVLLLRSDQRPELSSLSWAALAPKVVVERIPGDHFTMLTGSSLNACAARIRTAVGAAPSEVSR